MKKYYYDLHIHSCLSPCGSEDMTPANIAAMAELKGLDFVSITDHNSTKNLEAFFHEAKKYNFIPIAGIEVTTIEEVHVLVFFKSLKDSILFGDLIYTRLNKIENNEKIFGEQEVYSIEDEVLYKEKYLLINSTNIGFDEIYELAKKYNGVAVPAHIDKDSYSLISNLGFVPEDSKFKSTEIFKKDNTSNLEMANKYLEKVNKIYNSDAHYLKDINERLNYLELEEKSSSFLIEFLDKYK